MVGPGLFLPLRFEAAPGAAAVQFGSREPPEVTIRCGCLEEKDWGWEVLRGTVIAGLQVRVMRDPE